jgi:hypothetical protein
MPKKINSCNPGDSDQTLGQFSYWITHFSHLIFFQKDEDIAKYKNDMNILAQEVTSLKTEADNAHAHTKDGCKLALEKLFEIVKTFTQVEREEILRFIFDTLEAEYVGLRLPVAPGIIADETKITRL